MFCSDDHSLTLWATNEQCSCVRHVLYFGDTSATRQPVADNLSRTGREPRHKERGCADALLRTICLSNRLVHCFKRKFVCAVRALRGQRASDKTGKYNTLRCRRQCGALCSTRPPPSPKCNLCLRHRSGLRWRAAAFDYGSVAVVDPVWDEMNRVNYAP